VNASAMNFVGISGSELILGFVVSGSKLVKLIVRGVGLGLQAFGVTSFLLRPRMELHSRVAGVGPILLSNLGWDGSTELIAAFAAVGAFGLQRNLGDCVMLRTLIAGSFSAIWAGQNGGTGDALVGLYVLPT